jgi:predicted metal-dependent hydrolase
LKDPLIPPPRTSAAEQLLLPLEPAPSLDEIFTRTFRRMRIHHPIAEFKAEFRPFSGLRSVVRLKNHRVEAQISDLLGKSSPIVLEALAEILLAKLFRRRPSREARECYMAHVMSPAIRDHIETTRRERSRKRLLHPRGKHFDLQKIFDDVNQRFFQGKIPRVRLGWSFRKSRTILGHYDSAHGSITISRWLDSPSVPDYLVEYLVYHEMLHIVYPVQRNGHRRIVHSREFQAAERRFPQYELARHAMKRHTFEC